MWLQVLCPIGIVIIPLLVLWVFLEIEYRKLINDSKRNQVNKSVREWLKYRKEK